MSDRRPNEETPVDLLAGRYRIDSPLGAGGMGEVFLAQDTLLERRVAIKLLPAEVQTDPIARGRLRREALAAASLDHPFICKVYEIGDAEGRLFIAMEYVEGETLHVVARRALLPMRQVVEMATELAEALEEAHRRGVVHRDLKPANVMITPQGHVKVMDFGLAKPLAPDSGAEMGSDAATLLTESGARVGTPGYMSPEQVLGGPLDPRSDIFSLGVILHELATGDTRFCATIRRRRWPRSCGIPRRPARARSTAWRASAPSSIGCSPRRAPSGTRQCASFGLHSKPCASACGRRRRRVPWRAPRRCRRSARRLSAATRKPPTCSGCSIAC